MATSSWMIFAFAMSQFLLGQAQYYGGQPEEQYQDSAPENMIPQIPWPEWLPRDLSSIPSNLPRPGTWVPANSGGEGGGGGGGGGGGQSGGPGIPEAIQNLFGGAAPPPSLPGIPGRTNYATTNKRRFPKGDPRNCIKDGEDINIMQVVPGLGWDNLRNVETGMVTSFSYSQCKVTADRKYLIPDETFAIPIKTSYVERNSEFIDNWDSYKSVTSRSINTGFDFFGKIGGKFSNEFINIKSRMYNEKSLLMRTELRHRFHSIKQLPDSKLHPSFKRRIMDIMSLLKSNDSRYADYNTQLLIRDYGTHYLTSVDAGALLVQEENLKSTIKSAYSGRTSSITAAGGLEFFSALKANAGYSSSNGQSSLEAYRSSRTSSRIMSYGGPPFSVGMSLSEWENNLTNNLVTVDRIGRPIHNVITIENMKPEIMSAAEILELKNLVQAVARRYYDFNTYLGCTDVNAPNFDYQANSQLPGSCKMAASNYTFGGVFQMCSYLSNANGMCGTLYQKNPITGSYSCPAGYDSILLLEGIATRPKTDKKCKLVKKCSFWVFNCRHEEQCQYIPKTEKVRHQTFWCAPNKKRVPNTGYLFGGIYSDDLNNPITRSKTCPNHYVSMRIGSHAKICLSEDYELGHQFSLPFGGFFSCKGGNKLATSNGSAFLNNPRDWPMRCPGGFTQHLALTDKSCRVNFCVRAGTLLRATDLDIVLPPFEPSPGMRENSTMDMFEIVDPNRFPPAAAKSSPVGTFNGTANPVFGTAFNRLPDGAASLHSVGSLFGCLMLVMGVLISSLQL